MRWWQWVLVVLAAALLVALAHVGIEGQRRCLKELERRGVQWPPWVLPRPPGH